MAFFSNPRRVAAAGFALALVLVVFFIQLQHVDASDMGSYLGATLLPALVRWAHVLSGVMWIGLLYYFNFVQMPTMPKIPDELKPAVGRFIAPQALFWFRWGAAATVGFGLILAWQNNYLIPALTIGGADGFGVPRNIVIGIGMWLGLIMAFNVWAIIWPNQQKALNIGGLYPNLTPPEKAAAAKTAMIFSRTNMLLSIPMLLCMIAAGHL